MEVAANTTTPSTQAPNTPTTDSKPVETKVEPPKEDTSAKRFAAITKKERAILDRDRALKAREDAITAKEARLKEYDDMPNLLKSKPNDALSKFGLTYNDITETILNDGKVTPEVVRKETRTELEEIRAQLKAEREAREADKKQLLELENQRILKSFNDNVKDVVKKNAEKYELIALYGQEERVAQYIQQHYDTTAAESEDGKGELLKIEDAADKLEDLLTKHYEKVLAAKKFSSRLASKPKEEAPKIQSTQSTKNLTNEITTSSPSMLPHKTEQDRIRRAMEKLAGA